MQNKLKTLILPLVACGLFLGLICVLTKQLRTIQRTRGNTTPSRDTRDGIDYNRWYNDNPDIARPAAEFHAATPQERRARESSKASESLDILRMTAGGREVNMRLTPGYVLPLTVHKDRSQRQEGWIQKEVVFALQQESIVDAYAIGLEKKPSPMSVYAFGRLRLSRDKAHWNECAQVDLAGNPVRGNTPVQAAKYAKFELYVNQSPSAPHDLSITLTSLHLYGKKK